MVRKYFLLILTLLVAIIAFAQFPTYTSRIYWPGMYHDDDNWGEYRLGTWYKDAFQVKWMVMNKDPYVGYPYHSGNTVGVNDTVKVQLYFANETDDDYYIGASSPQDWFYPVIYDPYVDVFTSPMLADTSIFDYRFEYWITGPHGAIIAQPDTIFSSKVHGYGRVYMMVYTMWGLAPGTFRVIMKPTTFKPSDVRLLLDRSPNIYTMSTGQSILDTMNSLSSIADNALSRREFTLFNTYVDSIFSLNPQSLLGWALRYNGYDAQNDTTNALDALDSMLYNIENLIDPLIPDTSRMTPVHKAWLRQWKADYEYFQGRMLYPWNWIGYPE